MTKERKETILKCIGIINDAMLDLSSMRDEEQDAYDNLPEGLMESEMGDSMMEAAEILDSAVSCLDCIDFDPDSLSESQMNVALGLSIWGDAVNVGDAVIHKKFGDGVIIRLEGKYIFVGFPGKETKFLFPDIFVNGFLRLKDE